MLKKHSGVQIVSVNHSISRAHGIMTFRIDCYSTAYNTSSSAMVETTRARWF